MTVIRTITLIFVFFVGLNLGSMYYDLINSLTNIFMGFILGCGFTTLIFAEEIKKGSELIKNNEESKGETQ
jgi:uncharacterized membrane protein YccC